MRITKVTAGAEAGRTRIEFERTVPERFGHFLLHSIGREGKLADLRWQLLERMRTNDNPLLVQIGAHDGQDPFNEFLVRHTDVPAVLVEPQAAPFERLRQKYADRPHTICVQKAIANKVGPLTLWRAEFIGSDKAWGTAITSSEPDHIRKIMRRHPIYRLRGYHIEPETVEAATLHEVLEETGIAPKRITAFVCDTEGNDTDIVGQLLDVEARPSIIQYEHLHTKPAAAALLNRRLQRYGYHLAQNYMDTLAYQSIDAR